MELHFGLTTLPFPNVSEGNISGKNCDTIEGSAHNPDLSRLNHGILRKLVVVGCLVSAAVSLDKE